MDYCNWLSEKEGLVPCYTIDKKNIDPNNKDQRDKTKWKVECNFNANGYRLPTEAEWEYAARGGDKSKGYEYAGSNNAKEYAIYSIIVSWWPEVFHTITYSVGSKKPNELGLYDMSGHVWEWCWDWYDKDYYKESSKENPLGPESGKTIVLRGGAWNSHPVDICVSNRKAAAQNDGYIDWTMGFRVARSAK